MTQTTTEISFTSEGFEAFLATRSEPSWLTNLRKAAWSQFNELPWPNRRDEEWMRTDIRLFNLDKFSLTSDTDQQMPEAVLTGGVDLGGGCNSLNGMTQNSFLDSEVSEKGVIFGPLSELICEHEKKLRPHFFKVFDANFDKFSALHAAFWNSGTVLYVPRGVVIEKPFHSISALTKDGTDLGHTLVIIEDGAEATLLAESTSTGSIDPQSSSLHCGAVEITVGQGANFRYVNLQDWSQRTWHFAHQKATVDRDATFQWTVGALGSRLSKVNQHVALVGERANSQVNGVMFTENKQHLSYHTLQHHIAENCTSDFLYKAALQDTSQTVWRGMIKVDEAAQKTDGYQRNDNLLLSRTARADSIPGLEIEADDVRCTHGSTSGKDDEELIFYARSRGFTRSEAIQMIVTGFFQQIFDRVTIESVREALGLAIKRRIREYE